MSDNLKKRTLTALLWSFFERVGQKGVKFVISIILARLLMPADFGLLALVTMFLGLAQTFVDSGLGTALIQKKRHEFIDECTIFYTNIGIGIICAVVIYWVAPWAAVYFGEPLLIDMLRVLSIVVVIDSIANIQLTVATKKIDFKTQFNVSFIVSILSGCVGVYMALNGYGVWSLVLMVLSRSVCSAVLLFLLVKWRPKLIYSIQSLRYLFSFGSKIFFSALLDRAFNSSYSIIIAKVYSPVDLGFYGRAQSLQQMPVDAVFQSVARVTFPVFSMLQDDLPRLKRGMRQSLIAMSFFIMPTMIGLAVTAKSVVLLLLTDKWLVIVPYLQLLCVVGLLFPLNAINLNVLKALGRSGLFLKLEIVKKILAASVLAVTYQYGIEIMISGMIVTASIAFYLNAYFNGKLLGYSFSEQIGDCIWMLLASIVMGYLVVSVSYLEFPSLSVFLFVQVLTGFMSYLALCYLLRIPVLIEIVDKLKRK